MFQFFNNMFTINKSSQFFVSKFNHCSTVCQHNNGVFIAWYSGSSECCDDQSVYVIFIDKSSNKSEMVRIGDCTGNPVLWSHNNEAVLLWSKFENSKNIKRTVDRWKYCSLWIQRLIYTNKITMLGEPIKIADSNQHLLGRCNPITTKNGHLLLPLYDELNRECVIFVGSNLQFEEQSRFGHNMIQPTIWKHGTKLCSLSRNFNANSKKSFFCESNDNGLNWTQPILSDIYNKNNSLHVFNWNNENIILWNDTAETYRNKMTVGLTKNINCSNRIKAESIKIVGPQYGSYPSVCSDAAGNLNFTFTNINKIEHHVWNSKFFKSERDKRNKENKENKEREIKNIL